MIMPQRKIAENIENIEILELKRAMHTIMRTCITMHYSMHYIMH